MKPKNNYERFALQNLIFLFGFIPVTAGLYGIYTGIEETASLSVDNHYRYLSGILLAIGLGFWSSIPNIEKKQTRVVLLTCLVLIGGLARLGGAIHAGDADSVMKFALMMELIITPLLCVWQGRIVLKYKSAL